MTLDELVALIARAEQYERSAIADSEHGLNNMLYAERADRKFPRLSRWNMYALALCATLLLCNPDKVSAQVLDNVTGLGVPVLLKSPAPRSAVRTAFPEDGPIGPCRLYGDDFPCVVTGTSFGVVQNIDGNWEWKPLARTIVADVAERIMPWSDFHGNAVTESFNRKRNIGKFKRSRFGVSGVAGVQPELLNGIISTPWLHIQPAIDTNPRLRLRNSKVGGVPRGIGRSLGFIGGRLGVGSGISSVSSGAPRVNKSAPDQEDSDGANQDFHRGGQHRAERPFRHSQLSYKIVLSALLIGCGLWAILRGFQRAGDALEAVLDGGRRCWFGVVLGFGLIIGGAALGAGTFAYWIAQG